VLLVRIRSDQGITGRNGFYEAGDIRHPD
jgi:hypothetical protein